MPCPESGEVGTHKVFEDDSVVIWEMRLEPGESSKLHTHVLPYVFYVLEVWPITAHPPVLMHANLHGWHAL